MAKVSHEASEPLFGLGSKLSKALELSAPESRQGVSISGIINKPFNYDALKSYYISNPHHGTCIRTKAESSVGLGLEDETAEKALDALCPTHWRALASEFAEDFFNPCSSYIEVVRDESGAIVALYPLPAASVWVEIEGLGVAALWHYYVQVDDGIETRMARFGDAERVAQVLNLKPAEVSEVIQFILPSPFSRFYGFPDWLPAVARIELVQRMMQYNFDFFNNRGVPDIMGFILGPDLGKTAWDAMMAELNSNVGSGNARKSNFFNIPGEKATVQIERLADSLSFDLDRSAKALEVLALEIVTSHRVPPMLAGIQIPGKMGAANELTQALIGFQALVIGPAQRIFEKTLDATLGHPTLGVPGLKPGSFKHKEITKKLTEALQAAQPLDTASRMKQTVTEAGVEGRNLNDGLKK